MKTRSILFAALATACALSVMPASARGQIFVTSLGEVGEQFDSTVSEYSLSGSLINANLITGLNDPQFLAAVNGDIYIADQYNDRISEYTTSGAVVNLNLITGLNNNPVGIAISGGDIFVTSSDGGYVGEYTMAGATVNAQLITGLINPRGIAVSGGEIFVPNGQMISAYTTGGVPINTALITNEVANGLAVSGSNLFVTNYGNGSDVGRLDEYTTSGTFVGTQVSGLNVPYDVATAPNGSVYYTYLDPDAHTSGEIGQYPGARIVASDDEHPYGIAVATVLTPEPASWALLATGAIALLLFGRRFGGQHLSRR